MEVGIVAYILPCLEKNAAHATIGTIPILSLHAYLSFHRAKMNSGIRGYCETLARWYL
jgi:hypothetical protein